MRKLTIVLLSGLISSLVAVFAVGQQRLSDIAGTVKLNQPDEDKAVITNHDVEQAPRGPSLPDTPYGKCLSWKLEVFGSELEELRERVSSREAVARVLWYSEFLMQCDVVIELADALASCTPDGAWQTIGHQELMTAVNACRSVALDAKSWSQGDKYQLAVYTYRRLGDAMPQFATAQRGLASYMTPPAPVREPERVKVPREIREYCGALWPDRPDNRAGCVREQEDAFFALTSRTADDIGLELAAFTSIRSDCVRSFEGDYKLRDDCERRMIRTQRR